jgi:hypothetical protein
VPQGLVPGKTAMRDAATNTLHCSELEAEQLIDTMVSRGLVRFVQDEGRPDLQGKWRMG